MDSLLSSWKLSKESMQEAIIGNIWFICPKDKSHKTHKSPLAYCQLSRIPNEATHKWTSENAAGLDVLKRVVDDGFGKLLHEVVRDKHGA